MFAWWGRMVYRFRYIVIAVMVALCAIGGVFSLDLGKHVTQSGFFDDGSESVRASVLADEVYGRDRRATSSASSPHRRARRSTIRSGRRRSSTNWTRSRPTTPTSSSVVRLPAWFPEAAARDTGQGPRVRLHHPQGRQRRRSPEQLQGDRARPADVDDGKIKLAGLNPLANELTGTIAKDQKRMEVLALPLVAIVLFFVFGGVVAASLPVIVGGLSIVGSLGILRLVISMPANPCTSSPSRS